MPLIAEHLLSSNQCLPDFVLSAALSVVDEHQRGNPVKRLNSQQASGWYDAYTETTHYTTKHNAGHYVRIR